MGWFRAMRYGSSTEYLVARCAAVRARSCSVERVAQLAASSSRLGIVAGEGVGFAAVDTVEQTATELHSRHFSAPHAQLLLWALQLALVGMVAWHAIEKFPLRLSALIGLCGAALIFLVVSASAATRFLFTPSDRRVVLPGLGGLVLLSALHAQLSPLVSLLLPLLAGAVLTAVVCDRERSGRREQNVLPVLLLSWVLWGVAAAQYHYGYYLALAGERPSAVAESLAYASVVQLVLLVSALRSGRRGWPRKLAFMTLTVSALGTCALLVGHLRAFAFQWVASEEVAQVRFASALWGVCGATVLRIAALHRQSRSSGWLGIAVVTTFAICLAALPTIARNVPELRDPALREACEGRTPPPHAPAHLLLHLLAAEDPLFVHHRGVDAHRLRMAAQETLRTGRYGRGGSTISMQLAKLCSLSQEKRALRKIQQILLAWWLELRYSKAELLQRYLAAVPFAPQVRGFSAAAQHYFATPLASLTPEQGLQLVLTVYDPGAFQPHTVPVSREVMLRRAVIRSRARAHCTMMLPKRDFLDLRAESVIDTGVHRCPQYQGIQW